MGGLFVCAMNGKTFLLNEETKKKSSFEDNVKIKIPLSNLLLITQEAGVMCTMRERCSSHLQRTH